MAKIEREMAYRQRAKDFLRGVEGKIRYLEGLSDEPDRYLTAIQICLARAAQCLAELGFFPEVDMAVIMNDSLVIQKRPLLCIASEGSNNYFLNPKGRLYVSTQAISEEGSEIPLFGENQPDVDNGGYIRFFSVALAVVGKVYFRR